MSLLATKKDRLYTAIVAVVAVLAVLLGYFLLSGGKSHTLYARFANAQFIVPGNTVHVNGVTEGKVTSMKVDSKDNQAIVKMTLNGGAWPVHTDATATVRPVTILGEQYVDLSTGTPSAPAMANGATIPEAQTTSATNLQSVLNAVTDPTAASLGTFISSLGQGMAGQGQDAQDAIKALEPAMTNTSALVKLVNSQNQLLNSMIDNVTPVLHSLDTNQGTTLNSLLSTTNNLLGATAQSSTNVGTDLQELPGTLNAATNTFNQLGNLSDQATPALASITPLTGNLNQVSHEALAFSQAANPAVQSLTPLLTQAQTLITKATPVVNTLRSAGPQTLADLQNGQTILAGNASVTSLHNLFAFLAEWASTTGDYDNTSHYFRFHAQGDCSIVPVANPLCPQASGNANGTTSAKPAAKPAAAPAPAASPVAGAPGIINNILSQPGQIVNNVVGGLLGNGGSASTNTSGSATGLTPSQEQNMVGYLLGGL